MVEETTQTDKSVTKGVKRKDENPDDAERNHDREDDMSSLEKAKSTHPGAIHTVESSHKANRSGDTSDPAYLPERSQRRTSW